MKKSGVDLGKEMWLMLADTFKVVARENDAITQADKSQIWAGFLAGAGGSMCCDLGRENALAVIDAVKGAMRIATDPATRSE